MVDQQLAGFSNLLIVVALAVYTVAFIAFGIDLAFSGARRSERRFERARAAQKMSAVATSSKASGAAGATATAVMERPDEDEAQDGAGSVSGLIGPDERNANRQALASGDGLETSHLFSGTTARRPAASFALAMMVVAFVAHLGGVVLRGWATQRVPWGNMYEFAVTGGCVIIAMFLGLLLWRDLRYLGTFILGPMLLTMMVAQTQWFLPAAQLTPGLQNSHWLVIHVSVAILATALYALGAVATILQLVQTAREKRSAQWGAMAKLPGAHDLEGLAFRLNAIGFVLWTFTLIAGAIWANYAWGRPWGWDPKEVWTFVIWVVYAAYLHARSTRGFRGTRAAIFSLVGVVCLILNFTVVNTMLNGMHSYSGL
ncbi:c-type cytochrome biogenesis protein CcsB [Devriesea agamarum]|uniref:c-type cytochrome biogenesis protein CcsB n=1 Tax=Devriesea agamarum TaxID=472569 RepID=UPI00071E1672|nr:c-type cytochrome biogenesis protein CcsB [Devriesea agamarum]